MWRGVWREEGGGGGARATEGKRKIKQKKKSEIRLNTKGRQTGISTDNNNPETERCSGYQPSLRVILLIRKS